jgi:hypothetical protein
MLQSFIVKLEKVEQEHLYVVIYYIAEEPIILMKQDSIIRKNVSIKPNQVLHNPLKYAISNISSKYSNHQIIVHNSKN